jgi:glycosyltransferase involved in cell wall biosynthesis
VRAIDLILKSPSPSAGADRITRAWARQYSWDACTDRTLAVYRQVAGQQPVRHNRDHRISQGAAP